MANYFEYEYIPAWPWDIRKIWLLLIFCLFSSNHRPVRPPPPQRKKTKSLKRYVGLKFICHFLSNILPGIPFPMKLSVLHAPITSYSTRAWIRVAFLLGPFPTGPSCLKNILRLFRKVLHTCGFRRSRVDSEGRMQNFSEKPQNILQTRRTCRKRTKKERDSNSSTGAGTRDRCTEDGKFHRKWNPRRYIR